LCNYRLRYGLQKNTTTLTGFSVLPIYATIALDGTQTLKSTFIPANATNLNITWTSSNNAVATVNSWGTITAVSIGSAIITATTEDGAKTAI